MFRPVPYRPGELVVLSCLPALFWLLISSPAHAQAYWLPVPSPATGHLNAVQFIDSTYGWIVGEGGTLLRSTDGGTSWTRISPGVTYDLVDIQMRNRMEGCALAHDVTPTAAWTRLLFTTDGGLTWAMESFPEPDVVLNSAFFSDARNAWIAGESAMLVGTHDGGHTWTQAVPDTGVPPVGDLRKIRFLTPRYGYAMGGRFDLTGVLWRTRDGGATWSTTLAAPEPINDVHFIDSLNVIGVTGDYDYGSGIVRTTDAGDHWQYTYLGIWGDARAMSFRSPSEGWVALGFAGACMVTRDTGRTWQSMFTPETTSVSSIQFFTERRGIMVGAQGKIFRFDPDAVAVPEGEGLPSETRLFPPYPNPFNPATTIAFRLGAGAQVVLAVYDLTGRRVATLVDGYREAGDHRAVFDAVGLASGVYFCRLEVFGRFGASTATGKLLLMR